MNAIEREYAEYQANNTNNENFGFIEVCYEEEINGWFCQNMQSGATTTIHGGKWMSEKQVREAAANWI